MARDCVVLAAIAGLQAMTCLAQVSSVVSLSNGVRLRIGEQGGGNSLKAGLAPASGNSFYRMFRDENGLVVFAYELAVERTPDGARFQITAKSAGTEFAARFPNADAGKPVPTLSEPRQSPLLASGESFSIDIPSNPGGAAKVTDVVEVRLGRAGAASSDSASASGGLRFAGLKVYINRTLATPAPAGGVVSGRFTMFYLPGRGGYFFSTEPVEASGFVEAGWIDRARMQFTIENETYDCTADGPILTQSDRGEIWVYHDPQYKPTGNWAKDLPSGDAKEEYFTAASDSLWWWLH